MKKKKGAALPTAIILCMFMLIVTFGVAYLVIDNFTVNRISELDNNAELIFLTSHNEYVKGIKANASADISTIITDKTYVYKEYKKNDDVRALVAKNLAGEMKFYSVYDFDQDKLLAYQTSDFYITNDGVYDYLGGIVPMENA